eukprot:637127-Rhodomonas_salina.1
MCYYYRRSDGHGRTRVDIRTQRFASGQNCASEALLVWPDKAIPSSLHPESFDSSFTAVLPRQSTYCYYCNTKGCNDSNFCLLLLPGITGQTGVAPTIPAVIRGLLLLIVVPGITLLTTSSTSTTRRTRTATPTATASTTHSTPPKWGRGERKRGDAAEEG